MSRISTPSRVAVALAWMDQVELVACRQFNLAVRSAGLLKLFRIASRLGDGVLWYTSVAILAITYGAEGRQIALQCAVAGVSGLLVYRSLKNVLVRERPYITHSAIVCAGRPLDRFSFPSGHTLHAVSFTTVICSSIPQLAWILVPMAALIAGSRVVLGLHYPSDVAAGGMLGALLATTTTAFIGA